MRPGRRLVLVRAGAQVSRAEPEGRRYPRPAIVTLVLQTAQVRGRGCDAAMSKKRANLFDRRAALPPQFGRGVAQDVGRDATEPSRLAVAPQMGVERCTRDRECPRVACRC